MSRNSQSNLYSYCIILSFAFFLYSCARPANPSGGPADENPPKLVLEESTPNFQTQFSERQIILEFDEFISLSNANKQIVISPPFTNFLKYTVRGKRLFIEFPEGEELREEATYQINFGSAIKDYTAGNELDNFTFVFSTGDVLDSLSLSGYVYDSATGEPSAETLVLLYDNLSDTAFQTEKPFYFSQTDDTGKFEINNVKSDTFQVFALSDQNLSLNYDQTNEAISFLDSLIILPDTNLTLLTLKLFDEREVPVLLNVDQKKRGRLVINFSNAPREMEIVKANNLDINFDYELQKDSCIVWYDTPLDSFDLFLDWEGSNDTVRINKIEKKRKASKFACRSCKNELNVFPGDSILIEFNKPIGSIDRNKILQIDSLDQMEIENVIFKDRFLKVIGNIVDTGTYEMLLLPEAVVDIFGKSIDTTKVFLEGKSGSVLGNINISLQNSNLDRQYIYELLDSKEELIESVIMKSDSVLNFNRVEGGQYYLRIIEDLDENGFWDSGNLKEKRYSEKIRKFQLEVLRQGWDLETSINLENEF